MCRYNCGKFSRQILASVAGVKDLRRPPGLHRPPGRYVGTQSEKPCGRQLYKISRNRTRQHCCIYLLDLSKFLVRNVSFVSIRSKLVSRGSTRVLGSGGPTFVGSAERGLRPAMPDFLHPGPARRRFEGLAVSGNTRSRSPTRVAALCVSNHVASKTPIQQDPLFWSNKGATWWSQKRKRLLFQIFEKIQVAHQCSGIFKQTINAMAIELTCQWEMNFCCTKLLLYRVMNCLFVQFLSFFVFFIFWQP